MGNFQFISDKNYMKRDSSTISTTMLGPNVLRFSGSWYTRDLEINHNLGYVPLFRLYYEAFQDGKLMEAFQDTNYSLPNPPNANRGVDDGPTCLSWADDTKIYIRLFFPTTALSAISFPIYCVIYKDYGIPA